MSFLSGHIYKIDIKMNEIDRACPSSSYDNQMRADHHYQWFALIDIFLATKALVEESTNMLRSSSHQPAPKITSREKLDQRYHRHAHYADHTSSPSQGCSKATPLEHPCSYSQWQ